MIYTTYYQSPIGELLLAAQVDALIGIWLVGQKYYLKGISEPMTERADYPILVQTAQWLDRYFAGERPEIAELTLRPQGSDFRQAVWEILCHIPYGDTLTYGEIAALIAHKNGRPTMSAQAVGGAVGHNPIAIIIPCHRVMGTNGNLTGYAGGLDKKIQLLQHEGIDVHQLSMPKRSTAP